MNGWHEDFEDLGIETWEKGEEEGAWETAMEWGLDNHDDDDDEED